MDNSETKPSVAACDLEHVHQREQLKSTTSGMHTLLKQIRVKSGMQELRARRRRRDILIGITTVAIIAAMLVWIIVNLKH